MSMKFKTDAKAFAEALATVKNGVSSRSRVEILTGVRLETTTATKPLSIYGTDMDVSVRTLLSVTGGGKGVCVVQAAALANALGTFDGELAFAVEDDRLVASQNGTRVTFPLFTKEDFPVIPDDGKRAATVSVAEFSEAFDKVKAAYSRDESRPVLTGVKIEMKNGKGMLAATDSYRLNVCPFVTEKRGGNFDGTVAGSTLELVQKLSKKHDDLEIFVGDRRYSFSFGDVVVSAREIEGQYPNWTQLIPDKWEWSVTAPTKDLVKALTRMVKLARGNAPVACALKPGKPAVLSLDSRDGACVEETLAASTHTSPETLSIGLNPEFFLQSVKSTDGEEVVIHGITPLRPVFINSDDKVSSPPAGVLLMPVKLASSF